MRKLRLIKLAIFHLADKIRHCEFIISFFERKPTDKHPFMSTLSANRTLEGLFFKRCFFAALRSADLRAD